MKKLIFALLCVIMAQQVFAQAPNLYEQLCEVNEEWTKNKAIAFALGLHQKPTFTQEQDLLSFHIQTLADIFAQKSTSQLTNYQKTSRVKHIQHLYQYSQLRDCPRNYYLLYRNPVFIDANNRYCAVAYLMLQDGKKEFCEQVQKTNNFIFIRQINHPIFADWQQNSGFTLDELAWIQPGYDPLVKFVQYNQFKNGKPIKISPKVSKNWYNPSQDTTVFMGTVFFGIGIDPAHKLKKMGYKGKQPQWDKVNDRITAINVFKGEIYIATDSVTYIYTNDTTILTKERSGIQKFNQKKEVWETVLDLKGKHRVFKLKNFNGKLLAYGGYVSYSFAQEYKSTYSSFLGNYDGKNWEIDSKDYESIIFMVLASKGKINYLGTVTNGLDNVSMQPEN